MRTGTTPWRLLAWFVASSALAACADTGRTAGAGAPARAADADRTIAIEAGAPFAFSPADLTVTAGETVTFELTNVDLIDHDFVLGDEDAQELHGDATREQAGADLDVGMPHEVGHDEPTGVRVPAGETATITWAFPGPGTVLYGCHEPGHYEAGMLGTITVLG